MKIFSPASQNQKAGKDLSISAIYSLVLSPWQLNHGYGTFDKYLSSLCLEASSCGIPTASPGNPHPCH